MVQSTLQTDFAGRRGPLFRLAFRAGVLTVLTLGIYRFWMKTRLRRYYWSSVRPGGHPLEYVGEPLEKLLGFLIAVVILAFYIGIVNLILMFFSYAVFQGNVTAYALSFLGVIPIWFFALYRARRYVLARTRWRGLRFGLEPGAWGYAWRALVHWGITILTAGLLWPRMTFWLEKYKTDRTFLGTARLHQGGTWQMLYPAFVPVVVCLFFTGLSAFFLYREDFRFAPVLGLALFALPAAAIRYRVKSLELLASAKTAGPLGLVARPRVGRVLGIYAVGYGLTYVVVLLLAAGLAVAVLASLGIGSMIGAEVESDMPGWFTAVWIAVYFLIFILWGVMQHVFVTQPLWRHYAETLTVTGAGDLSHFRQRDRDAFGEAEGFAEALDLGASI